MAMTTARRRIPTGAVVGVLRCLDGRTRTGTVLRRLDPDECRMFEADASLGPWYEVSTENGVSWHHGFNLHERGR